MKHRYKTLSRVVSLLLTTAILMTTPTFSVFAEEIAENVQHANGTEENTSGGNAAGTEETEISDANPDEMPEEDCLVSDDTSEIELFTSSDSEFEYITPDIIVPFDTSISERESITVNTGALTYSEKLLSFSGLNGAENPLRLQYNSDDASLYDLFSRQYLFDCDYRVTYKYTYRNASTGKYLGTDGTVVEEFENEKDARALEEDVKNDNGLISYSSAYGCKVLTKTTVQVTKINCTYKYRNTTFPETRNEELFGLSGGWFFDLPYTDGKTNTLYLPGVGKYTYTKSNRTYTVHTQNGQLPISMQWLDSKDLGEAGIAVCVVTTQDGTAYYFDANKRCICAKDRFDNAIIYRWNEAGHFAGILDTDGKEITVDYADTDTQRTITIVAPDQSETVLSLDAAEEFLLHDDEHGWDVTDAYWIPSEIRYPSGEIIKFSYQRTPATVYHHLNGRYGQSSLVFMLLTEVHFPTGSALRYRYEEAPALIGGTGVDRAFRIVKRSTIGANADIHSTEYKYDGSYAMMSSKKENVTYSVETVPLQANPCTQKHTFNYKHRCIDMQYVQGGNVLKETETKYNSWGHPKQIDTRFHSSNQKTARKVTELFTYNSFGNLLTYISPKAGGNSSNTEYRTTYTYDSTYNLPLTVEYKQDAATTIKTVNTLTADKKSIAETATYVNNTLTALTTYTYNARGQVTAKTDCLDLAAKTGVTTVYTYNGANLATETITGLTDADGNALPDLVTAYTYDTMGRLLTATDAAGRTTTNTYDVRGRLLTATAPDGSVTAYTYDLTANDTTVSQPGREDIVVDFDSIGQKQAVYYPSGDLQKEYYYDTAGRLVIEATGRGSSAANTVYYTYDPLDRLIEKRICDKDGVELYRENTAYDDALTKTQALVTKTVLGEDGAPGTVAKTYINAYGETVREDVGGVVTDYAYDFVGNRTCTTYTEDGRTVSASGTYDFRGNVLTETNALGNTRTITYDAIGRKIAESDFKGNATTYAYDAAGRLLISSAPLDGDARSVVKYTYDSASNVTRQMQSAEAVGAEAPVWRTVEYVYDDRNRVTDIAQTADETHKVWTHYAYNEAGDLTDIYTGLSLKWSLAVNPETYSHTRYVYNNRGKAASLTDALGQTETYVYDALGYLIEATERNGKVTRYTYNGLGKPLTEAIYMSVNANAPIAKTVYTYYKNGQIRSITADRSTVQYTYDALGNLLTDRDETTIRTYTYDSRGRKSGYALTVGDTEISTAAYAYDDLNRLVSVTEGGVTTTYTYDANGNRASQTTGEVSVAYTYNDANLVTSLTNTLTNASGEAVIPSAFAYTYYADGNQHTKTETLLGGDPITSTYVYDGLGRLTSETKGEDSIAYTYDANGNRTGMNQNGTVTTYAYDANNRLLSETVGDTVTAYTYDANGNTLTAGDKTYTYNDRGQQTGYSNGTTTASYAYNPSGLRKAKTVGGSTKYFVYNGMNIVYEYSESVADGIAYFYGLNRTHNSEGEIYVYNAHGDVVQLVKDNSVVASYTYDAFGNLTSQIGESDNPFLYCGEYYDAETQTYYLRARYYNPANGRFTQQDTWAFMDASDPLSLNLYTYCCNNPILYVDPSGHLVQEDTIAHRDGRISDYQYLLILKLTERWYDAKTPEAKAEIHELAEAFRRNDYRYEDCTDVANAQLYANAESLSDKFKKESKTFSNLISYACVGYYWYTLVNTNGEWDYKVNPTEWMPDCGYFVYGGDIISLADYGNLNYGYTGTVLGLSPQTLYKGGGIAIGRQATQYEKDNYYSDSEIDHYFIQQGISLYGRPGLVHLPVQTILKIVRR